MAKVLVLGDVYFETQYFVEKLPQADQVAVSSEAVNIIGSKTLNVSRVLSRLGNKVCFHGKIGDDLFGGIAEDTLKNDYKLDIKHLSIIPSSKTGQIVVVTDTLGKNTITIDFGANRFLTIADVNRLLKDISDFDLVYCMTNLPLDILYAIIDECSRKKVMTFIDTPNQHDFLDLNKLKNATFITCNRPEAGAITKMQIRTLQDTQNACLVMRKSFPGNIIITLDVDGCVVLEKGSSMINHYPTATVKAVDETGAGDIFRAVFVSEYLADKSINEAIKKALSVATESVKIKGVNNTLNTLDLTDLRI